MKSIKSILVIAVIPSLVLTGCATIVGGSRYNAHIVVADNPDAKIVYQHEVIGTGNAYVKVPRSQADQFEFIVRQNGCEERKYSYHSKSFRTGAFIGTLICWTGLVGGIPIPWGAFLDFATGAIWKPNESEHNVIREDYKNFKYLVYYPNCSPDKDNDNNSEQVVVRLKNGSVIKGSLIEHIPGTSIKIQTKDGNLFVFKIDEVELISREPIK